MATVTRYNIASYFRASSAKSLVLLGFSKDQLVKNADICECAIHQICTKPQKYLEFPPCAHTNDLLYLFCVQQKVPLRCPCGFLAQREGLPEWRSLARAGAPGARRLGAHPLKARPPVPEPQPPGLQAPTTRCLKPRPPVSWP